MKSSVFNAMQQNNNSNLINMMQKFKANPMQFLLSKQLNIPNNIKDNPKEIIQHLLNTGQMSQEQLNRLQNMVQQFK